MAESKISGASISGPRTHSEREQASSAIATTPPREQIAATKREGQQPQIFKLVDKEQTILVPGCASFAIEFQEVAGVDFVTVRVNVGGDSTAHAIANAGEQFDFSCGSAKYVVSILLIDRQEGMVSVRLDRALS